MRDSAIFRGRFCEFANAKKYTEIACEKIDAEQDKKAKSGACYNLGLMYSKGEGVRQDFQKAFQYYKYSCDLGVGGGCNNLGVFYSKGQGIKRNISTAKKYYGKACDLGEQMGCDNYRKLNEAGVQ
ncbi:tetratricopeptide repeat protein [Helicobacter sp. 23-1044]